MTIGLYLIKQLKHKEADQSRETSSDKNHKIHEISIALYNQSIELWKLVLLCNILVYIWPVKYGYGLWNRTNTLCLSTFKFLN